MKYNFSNYNNYHFSQGSVKLLALQYLHTSRISLSIFMKKLKFDMMTMLLFSLTTI